MNMEEIRGEGERETRENYPFLLSSTHGGWDNLKQMIWDVGKQGGKN